MSELSLEITNINLRISKGGPEHTLATGMVTYNDGLNIRVRVMDSKKGPFAKLPNYRMGDGNDARFFDYVFFGGENGKALRDDLNDRVVSHYESMKANLAKKPANAEVPADATAGDDTPFTE